MVVKLHTHWRDCKAWKDSGLSLSSTSDQAVKLFDAALTQYVGWYEDDSVGGLAKTLADIKIADPKFAMGHVISVGLGLMAAGRSIRTDPNFKTQVENLDKLCGNITEREAKHVNAVKLWAHGHRSSATLVWEDILVDNPCDMLAIKLVYDNYIHTGKAAEMRDSLARVLPHWHPDIPHYGYMMGLYAFGLCETNMLSQAESSAKKGLEINGQDAWSTHALAHVYETQGRSKEGIKFMSTTMADWKKSNLLACHNTWHWALYHIERNEHQAAVDLFDKEISQRCKSGAMLDIVDACSILYRLETEGVTVGKARWEHVYEICRPHQDEHMSSFHDLHFLMAYLGAKKPEMTSQFIKSIRKFVEDHLDEDNGVITKNVGIAMCQALQAYDQGQFSEAVKLLLPMRYSVVQIGGSNAQRDVFNLLLINAATLSDDPSHRNLCRNLIYERKAGKTESPMSERMMQRWLDRHAH